MSKMEDAFMKIWIGKEMNHTISLFELYEEAYRNLVELVRLTKTDPLIVIGQAIEWFYQETLFNHKKEELASPQTPIEPAIKPAIEPAEEPSIEA